jgi:small subunit ribosomal protein S16
MAVVIRLRRAGSRKRPFYHMVVADSRMRRDGRFIEAVGYYNPMSRPELIEFSEERIGEWIRKGAKPSDTVDQLMKRKKKGGAPTSQKERKRSAQAAGKKASAAARESGAEEAAAAEPAAGEPPAEEPAPAGAE